MVQKRQKGMIVVEVTARMSVVVQKQIDAKLGAHCSNNRATRARERATSSSLQGVLSSCDKIDPSLCMVSGVAMDGCCSTGTDTGRDRSTALDARRPKTSSEH